MKGPNSSERRYSMSCLEGLRLLKRMQKDFPEASHEKLISLAPVISSDAESLDIEAAGLLLNLTGVDVSGDTKAFFRSCIFEMVRRYPPNWLPMMSAGRMVFLKKVGIDVSDVFSAAGVAVDSFSSEDISWWDDISGLSRHLRDREKLRQGRRAELMTLEIECKRLNHLGIDRNPRWIGVNNNQAGYDVLSFDKLCGEVRETFIEVKSTVRSPARFYLTRNEWDTAVEKGNRYFVYVWTFNGESESMQKISFADLKKHIPRDKGKGRWAVAEVRL